MSDSGPPPPPPHWAISLSAPPAAKQRSTGIPDPPGYQSTATSSKVPPPPGPLQTTRRNLTIPSQKSPSASRSAPTTAATDTLKLKKAWEAALAPAKQLPMTAIMMYMSGNSLQIFSIMMVGMAFKNPVMGLLATGTAFDRFESEGTKGKLAMVKVVYVLMQLLSLALGVWKVNAMGLLP
jgi:hypothetical protein